MTDNKIVLFRRHTIDVSIGKIPTQDHYPWVVRLAIEKANAYGDCGVSLFLLEDGTFGLEFNDFGPNTTKFGESKISLQDALDNVELVNLN